MKMVRHVTRKMKDGTAFLMSRYKNMSPKRMKALINRLYVKSGRALMVKSAHGVMVPSMGIEVIRVSHQDVLVCQLTKKFVSNPTLQQLIDSGCTHFYNDFIDQWVCLHEAKREEEESQDCLLSAI